MNPTSELMTITPELAKQWLALNTHNRKERPQVLRNFESILQRGEWRVTNDAISFFQNGAGETLGNGQHRLKAIANTGIAAPAFVVRGLEPDSQEVMDTQARRTLADFLSLNNEPMVTTLAGAVVQLHQWRTRKEIGRTIGLAYPTTPQSLALLNKEPALRLSLRIAQEIKRGLRGFSPALATALHYIFSEIDAEDADDFFHRLASAAELEEGSAIWLLRRYVEDNAVPRANGKGLGSYRLAALTIKAWNAYRNGTEIKRLRWSSGGSSPEPFPQPE